MPQHNQQYGGSYGQQRSHGPMGGPNSMGPMNGMNPMNSMAGMGMMGQGSQPMHGIMMSSGMGPGMGKMGIQVRTSKLVLLSYYIQIFWFQINAKL